jgi:hypothetical protein
LKLCDSEGCTTYYRRTRNAWEGNW